MTFLTVLGCTEILCSFRLVQEGKTGKEISESSRLEFWKIFSTDNFALSHAEDSTSGVFNRRGIADLQYLLGILLASREKSREQGWEVMDSFVLAYASLAASITLLLRLLACRNFTLDLEDLFCWCKREKWFLWTMAAAETAGNHGDAWDLT